MFQYATPANIDTIQAQLLSIFNSNITSRKELHEQLDTAIQLLQYSKRDIVHSIVQNHLKTLLINKHTLLQDSELQSLLDTLRACPPTFTSNRLVIDTYLRLIAILTTLGWLGCPEIEINFGMQLSELDSGAPSELTMLALLNIVIEMNQPTSVIKSFGKHRKTAVAFRDSQLLQILQKSYKIFLNSLSASGSPVATSPGTILDCSLQIVNACLNFDFLGYQADQENHGMTSAINVF
jgi:hypothetical protein